MKKILGYILSLVGIAALALTFDPVKKAAKITIPSIITPTYLTIGGLVILLVGLVFISRGGSRGGKQAAEVPIYQGKNVVGYRRT